MFRRGATKLDLSHKTPLTRPGSADHDVHPMDQPPPPALPPAEIALFLDVDGTLVDLAPRPDAVVVPGRLIDVLTALDERLEGALALVSGRPVADVDHLFTPLRLRASGVHGAEIRTAPQAAVTSTGAGRLPAALIASLGVVAAGHAGTIVEDKGYSVAVHYRANPSAGPALRQALASCMARSDLDLRLLPGHMVFEVKGAAFNKGVAVAAFMDGPPFAGRRPVFIGDDTTDLPAFEAALVAGGLAFSVTTPRAGVSGHFDDPGQVRAWLGRLAGVASAV